MSEQHPTLPAVDTGDSRPRGVAQMAMLRKRRRARSACVACRERKVRCDAVARYPDYCTNCKLDQAQCKIAPRAGRKRQTAALHAQEKVSHAGNLDTMALNKISVSPTKVISAATSTSDLSLERAFDLTGSPSMSTDWDYHLSTSFEASHKSHNSSYPALSSSGATQDLITPDQTYATSPSMNLDEFAVDNLLNDFNDFEALTEHPLGSFQLENPEVNNLHADLGISLNDLFPNTLEAFPSYPFKMGPAYLWVETWPVKDLDDQTWSEVASAKALSRPESKTVERLLCLYFQYLNPHLPVINERDIYYLVHPEFQTDGVPPKPISLALFNAIMFAASSFVLEDDALAAGFSSIRAMSCAFFTRAKTLYSLGCEDTAVGRAQICLLLSYRKTYGNYAFESEHFLLEAGRQLEEANVPSILSDQMSSTVESNLWMRLYISWALRIICITLGTKRANPLKRAVNMKLPDIQVSALNDDISFSWFLSAKTKQRLAHIFIAKVALFRLTVPFCRFLIRTSPGATSGNCFHPSLHSRKSFAAVTEELEEILADWSHKNAVVFEAPSFDMADEDRSALFVHQSFLSLTHDYHVSILHQINLSLDNTTTKWGVRIQQLSRQALWESVSSTTRTLEGLLSRNLVRYLPMSALLHILIPFTANNLFVKSTLRCNIVSLQDLSICARSFQILAERYDAADFYMDILDESLIITHKMMLHEHLNKENRQLEGKLEKFTNAEPKSPEIPFPQADIYSSVIRFQDMSFAMGCVDKGAVWREQNSHNLISV